MRRTASIIAALAIAALRPSPCAGAIGDMRVDDQIASAEVFTLPPKYCTGGFEYGQDQAPLLYAAAKYNPLYNFPMLFHSVMCQFQCYVDYGDTGGSFFSDDFAGCASPADRAEAAQTPVPTVSVRDKAVSQLVPFFAAGGVTNHGIITVGPLMHAYGGSPLCVWPASNVVDVSDGPVSAPTVAGANPLRAGVGRGGCFDVAAWLSCTNWAERPNGFHTTSHPMADLGAFLHETLSPHFNIDWTAKGMPAPGMSAYPESFFLGNSPNYVSSEPVPLAASNAVLRIEPWRRSWEALGGLACVAWHTNTNAFEYDAEDVWRYGTISAASSNAIVATIESRMGNAWMPEITDRMFFPEDGHGILTTDMWNQSPVTPAYSGPGPWDYWPQRGYYDNMPAITYDWTETNVNARTLTAPVSNYVGAATNFLCATCEKRWAFRKTVLEGSPDPIAETVISAVTTNFGHGNIEYTLTKAVYGPYSYTWTLENEEEPVVHVVCNSVSNFMRTALSARLTADRGWEGLRLFYSLESGPLAVSTVCHVEDGWNRHRRWTGDYGYGLQNLGNGYGYSRTDWSYFLGTSGNNIQGGMDTFLDYYIFGGDINPDECSELAHPLPREIIPCFKNTPLPYDSPWTGPGPNYTIQTAGPPPDYSRGASTNAWYTGGITNGQYEGWTHLIPAAADTNSPYGFSPSLPGYLIPPIDFDPSDVPSQPYVPSDTLVPVDRVYAWARSTFDIDNRAEMFYNVRWEPVRAWGVLNNVTITPDWPNPDERH